MGIHTSGGARGTPIKTFQLLDQFIATLGSTRTFFWPFLESTGVLVQSYGEQDESLIPSKIAAAVALDNASEGFQPLEHAAPGIHSYHFEAALNQHLIGADAAALSHSGGTDAAFSIGCFFYIDSGTGTLIAKYNAANTAREYKFDFAAGPDLRFFVYDEDQTAEEGVHTDTALSTRQWYFGVGTYSGIGGNGGAVADGMVLYVDGAAVTDVDTDDATYVDMEDLGGDIMIGATGDLAEPLNEFTGRIALPFITGKQLSAAEVTTLFGLGKTLLGL